MLQIWHLIVESNFKMKRLLKNKYFQSSIGSGFVQILNRFIAIISGVVFARLLGPEEFGIYVYAIAIMGFLMVLSEAGFPILIMREVSKFRAKKEYGELRSVLKKGVFILLSINLFILFFVVSIVLSLSVFFNDKELKVYVAAALLMPLMVFIKYASSALQGFGHVVTGQAINMLSIPFFTLIFFVIYIYFEIGEGGGYALMLVQIVSALFTLFIVFYLVKKVVCLDSGAGNKSVDLVSNKQLIRSAFSFVMIGGAGLLLTQIDIIVLGMFGSKEDVALYRIATQGAMLLVFFLHVSGNVVSPKFSMYYAENDNKKIFNLAVNSSKIVTLLSAPVFFILLFFGRELIVFVFGLEYNNSFQPMVFLIFAQMIAVVFGIPFYILNMTGNEKVVSRLIWLSALLNTLLNFVLVPFYGLIGAASSTAFSMVLFNSLLYYFCAKKLNLNIGFWRSTL